MLNEFFRINLPYGLQRNAGGEWSAFNREYLPLGWNNTSHKGDDFTSLPIHSIYKGLTEAKLKRLIPEHNMIHYDDLGNINRVFFYNDSTCPRSNPKYWDSYFKIIRGLSGLEIMRQRYA